MSLSRIHWTFIYNGTIWYYGTLFDTESDAIQVCGTYNSVGYYVILYVSDTVTCMVLYDTVSELWLEPYIYQQGEGNG